MRIVYSRSVQLVVHSKQCGSETFGSKVKNILQTISVDNCYNVTNFKTTHTFPNTWIHLYSHSHSHTRAAN